MLPTSRHISGVVRPKDLRVVAKSTGSHLSLDRSLLPDQIIHSAQGVPGSSRDGVRAFHSSARVQVPFDSTSYNTTEVPDFFVRYRQQRMDLGQNPEESGLMQPLADSILAGDVVASTRRLQTKVPFEHDIGDGRVVHSSGFVVPGPGHTCASSAARAKERERVETADLAQQKAAIAQRVSESNLSHVDATTLPSLHKVPFEVAEPDGTVKHASGYVPPTPIHKFRYTVATRVFRDCKASPAPTPARPKARQLSPGRAVLRTMHTTLGSGDS